MAEDIPNNPNMQKPSVPPNNKQKDKGLAELSKKMDELKNETKQTKDDANKNTDKVIKALDQNAKDSKPKKKTAEEIAEEGKNQKKFLDKLSGMFEGIKKGLSGMGGKDGLDLKPLIAMWAFFKKLGKLALMLGAGAVLSMISVEDIAKLWEGMKKLFHKTVEFLKPIIEHFKKYFKKTVLPQTVKLLLNTFDNIGDLFDDLKEQFKDWTKSDWKGKMLIALGGIKVIGDFVKEFAWDVVDWVWNLFAEEDGSVTKDVRKYMDETFGPAMTDAIVSIMAWTAGLFVVGKIFGPKWLTGPLWTGATWLFKATLGRLVMTIASTLSLYTWYYGGLMLAALSPYGWAIAGAAIVAALGVIYYDDIKEAAKTVFDSIKNVLRNAGIWINNSLADTAFGKWLGMEKMGMNHKGGLTNQEGVGTKVGPQPGEHLEHVSSEKSLADWERKAKTRQGKINDFIKTQQGNKEKSTQADRDRLKELMEEKKEATEVIKTLKEQIARENANKPKPETPYKIKIKNPITTTPLFDPASASANLRSDEGFREFAYNDNQGIRTIGYGFNMEKEGAESVMRSVGITKNWKDLWEGKAKLTEAEGRALMSSKKESAYFTKQAKRFAGGMWGDLTDGQRQGLYNMNYQMGNMDGWDGLKTAMLARDNDAIFHEIVNNSEMGRQTPNRAREHAARLAVFQNVPNESGYALAKLGKGSDGGNTINVYKGGDTNNSGGENHLYAKADPHAPKIEGLG